MAIVSGFSFYFFSGRIIIAGQVEVGEFRILAFFVAAMLLNSHWFKVNDQASVLLILSSMIVIAVDNSGRRWMSQIHLLCMFVLNIAMGGGLKAYLWGILMVHLPMLLWMGRNFRAPAIVKGLIFLVLAMLSGWLLLSNFNTNYFAKPEILLWLFLAFAIFPSFLAANLVSEPTRQLLWFQQYWLRIHLLVGADLYLPQLKNSMSATVASNIILVVVSGLFVLMFLRFRRSHWEPMLFSFQSLFMIYFIFSIGHAAVGVLSLLILVLVLNQRESKVFHYTPWLRVDRALRFGGFGGASFFLMSTILFQFASPDIWTAIVIWSVVIFLIGMLAWLHVHQLRITPQSDNRSALLKLNDFAWTFGSIIVALLGPVLMEKFPS